MVACRRDWGNRDDATKAADEVEASVNFGVEDVDILAPHHHHHHHHHEVEAVKAFKNGKRSTGMFAEGKLPSGDMPGQKLGRLFDAVGWLVYILRTAH